MRAALTLYAGQVIPVVRSADGDGGGVRD
jgi:hypothetical protein